MSLLTARGIRFVMRCDKEGGWAADKRFLRSGNAEAEVTLNKPTADDLRLGLPQHRAHHAPGAPDGPE